MKGKYSIEKRIAAVALAAVGLGLSGYWVLPWLMPIPDQLRQPQKPGLEFRDRNGVPLRKVLADGQRLEHPRSLEEIPPHLVAATVCAEDKRFWKHGGIDFIAMARAAKDAATERRMVSGASTITQQLVKITSPRRPRTAKAKLIEMLTARRLEMTWSKEKILAEYLNRLDYGNLLTGCAAASWGYFAKPLDDLTLAECAYLAGIPQAPSRHNPHRNPENAAARQQWILAKMCHEGLVDISTYSRAALQPLKLRSIYDAFEAPHAVDLILNRSRGRDHTGQMGEIRRTTIDMEFQRDVESALRAGLDAVAERNARHGAVVVIDNATGDVLALAGSGDYFSATGGQINGAWIPRSPGSALKPFTYLLALEQGDNPATIVDDLPVEYSGQSGTYRPVNYDRRYYGPMTYRAALANSLNVSAVKVLDRVGGARALQGALQDCGLTTLDQAAEHYGLGLTLGNAEVRLLELTNAYACLARLGVYRPYRLETGQPSAEKRVFDAAAAYLIADMLSDNLARSRAFGMDSVLRLPFPVACKTGTSTDFRDNWTVGFTPEFTVGVWVGNFTNAPMRDVTGVSGAGPVFRSVFLSLDRRYGTSWFERPNTIVEAEIDIRNGKRWLAGGAGERRESAISLAKQPELFRRGNEPPVAGPEDYDALGRARMPREYAAWLSEDATNWLGDHIVVEAGEGKGRAPVIVSPASESTIYLDPDFADSGSRLPLRIEGGEDAAVLLNWDSDTVRIERSEAGSVAILVPGRHCIRVRETTSGLTAETWVSVEAL